MLRRVAAYALCSFNKRRLYLPDFHVTLVGIHSLLREDFAFSIPDENWSTLTSFRAEADDLRSTQFVQKERGGQISIQFTQGKPVRSNAKKIDVEEVWAMLHRLRPFVLQDEQCYFHKTKKQLKRWLIHPGFRNYLDEIGDGFNLKIMQNNLRLLNDDQHLISKEHVMDWLNSFQYHRDQSKRKTVEDALNIFSKDQDGTPFILFSLVDMIKAIFALSDLIEALMLVESGVLSEIECPINYLQKT